MSKGVTNYELKDLIETLGKKQDTQGEKLDTIYKLLFGINGNPGVIERVRVLERFTASQKKFIWAVVVAAIGVIAAILVGG